MLAYTIQAIQRVNAIWPKLSTDTAVVTSWTPAIPVPPRPPSIPDGKEIQAQIRKATRRGGRIGILVGMRELERNGKSERAEALLRKQRDPIARLELFLLQRREGKEDQAISDVRAYLASSKLTDWPAPLVRAYAGQATDAEAINAASDDPDDLCEANYYLGRLRRSRDLLEKAASPECDESDFARDELNPN